MVFVLLIVWVGEYLFGVIRIVFFDMFIVMKFVCMVRVWVKLKLCCMVVELRVWERELVEFMCNILVFDCFCLIKFKLDVWVVVFFFK